jgi:hypothetical protein
MSNEKSASAQASAVLRDGLRAAGTLELAAIAALQGRFDVARSRASGLETSRQLDSQRESAVRKYASRT